MNEYEFNIDTSVNLSVEAESEKEARSKLTEVLQEYFAETSLTVSDDEAELIGTRKNI